MARQIRNLARSQKRIEPKKRFIIFCEGQNTEPAYFKALRRFHTKALVEIETIPGAGVPYTIATKAIERAHRRRRRDSYEERDEVWAVFDRDEHPRYLEAVNLCEQRGVRVGRSDPCFELWLVLHEADYDKPDGRDVVQRRLRELRPEYNPAGDKIPDCADLIHRVEAAEKRSLTQLELRKSQGDPFGCPSTTVGMLTAAIREAANLRS